MGNRAIEALPLNGSSLISKDTEVDFTAIRQKKVAIKATSSH
jgi:hypothetical protein